MASYNPPPRLGDSDNILLFKIAAALINLGTGTNGVNTVNGISGPNVVLTTSNISEGTNLYFINSRAIAAPLTGFVAGLGAVIPTDTILAALGRLEGRVALNDAKLTGADRILRAGDTLVGDLTFINSLHSLNLGGITSSFPAIGNVGAVVNFALADGSAPAGIQAGNVSLTSLQKSGVDFFSPQPVYGTGTSYTVTTTSAAVVLGSTSPILSLTGAGTWLIRGTVKISTNATSPGDLVVSVKMRRTNNTATDIPSSATTRRLPLFLSGVFTDYHVPLQEVVYTTLLTTDSITIFASVDIAPATNTISIVQASLIAVRIA